ncbi:MAG: hypothetical protein MUC29_01035 [Pyrinomonadaceae bacterium]|nr:hypothetical protein [Pyrinomonadaceae bacterium]
MTENRKKEWQELESKAQQMLDNPRLLPKDLHIKQFNQTLHLWISPTFTPEKHWIFNVPQHQLNPQPKPIVQQIIWQKDKDFQRLNNPLIGLQEGFHTEPTFEIKTIEIEFDFYQKLRSNLSEIQFPPFIKENILGIDGEYFGVKTLDNYHSAKTVWWSDFPKEWKELIDWYEKVRKFLEEKFNDR